MRSSTAPVPSYAMLRYHSAFMPSCRSPAFRRSPTGISVVKTVLSSLGAPTRSEMYGHLKRDREISFSLIGHLLLY
jgi:hypothetical protein